MLVKQLTVGMMGVCCYIVTCETTGKAAIIDPGGDEDRILDYCREKQLQVEYIINTHGHGDHIGGNDWFKQALGAKVLIHAADATMLTDNRKNFSEYLGQAYILGPPDILAEDGLMLKIGAHSVRVIHTPGHTPGCICLLADKFLISGDTLFELSIGRTDFPGGNHAQIVDSIRHKLFTLPDDTVVFPGHGPRTSIGMEKKNNPFVRPLA